MILSELDHWFVHEVLPLEAALVRFLRRNRRQEDDVDDLRQEVYARIYETAKKSRPEQVKPFAFSIARNLLIDLARRSQVVSIEAFADLEMLDTTADELTPERQAIGLEELHLLQDALNDLPTRCREVVKLRKIDGLSQREVAQHMGISEDTVEKQTSKGVRALADALLLKGVIVSMSRLRSKIRGKSSVG